MFKRRFRLPSPVLVISMVTLSLVLGGTAVAASTAKHGDKKADTKLIKKLAPSLSVKHAKTADSATHATSADSATNATNATNATHATSATSATTATNATNATHATSADTATSALSPGTLAPGKTLVGEWTVEGEATVTGTSAGGVISFAFPLASRPTKHYIAPGAGTPSGCTGDVTNPGAAPGNLCVFAAEAVNQSGDLIICDWEHGECFTSLASRFGAGLVAFSSGSTGQMESDGTWAVTAPTAPARRNQAPHEAHSSHHPASVR